MPASLSYAIGIDLGTTTSRIHYFRDSNALVMPSDVCAVRSIVAALPPTSSNRKHDWYTGPEAYGIEGCFARFKLQMRAMKELQAGSDFSRPEILAGRLLWILRQRLNRDLSSSLANASELVNALNDVESVTITVPAGWTAVERSATIFAAKMAGFTDVNIIEEPVAAYIAIATFYPDSIAGAKNVLVFDCGGGTLDLALIRRVMDGKKSQKTLPVVVGRLMDDNCRAGEAIDEIIARQWTNEEWPGEEVWEKLNEGEKSKLREAARTVKHTLNPQNLTEDPVAKSSAYPITINGTELSSDRLSLVRSRGPDPEARAGLDEIVEPLAARATEMIIELLKQCHLQDSEVNRIIMVGGSSYLRRVQEAVRALFPGKIPKVVVIEPEKAVVIGAATYQSMLNRQTLFSRKVFPFFEPTLTLDTYLKYQKEVKGSLSPEKLILGKAGQSLERDIRPRRHDDPLPIPTNMSFPTTWTVCQKQKTDDGYEHEIAAVKIQASPTSRLRARLFVEYRINRNGELSLWRPRLIGNSNSQGLEIMYKSPYDWADKSPSELAAAHGIKDAEVGHREI